MQNEIQKFMELAVADQIKTAGETVVITRPKQPSINITCKAVITSRDGAFDAEIGGAQYAVTGHALISRVSLEGGEFPKAGDNLTQATGEKWIMVNTILSQNDFGVSCDLIRKQ